MRKLFWLTIIAAVVWTVYWFIGANMLERQADVWFDERRMDGWAADADDISTRGFAFRFDTTLTDVRLADPDTGLGWEAPFFQILALAYRPNSFIAVWPDTQTLRTPAGDVVIAANDMRASVQLRPNLELALDEAIFDLDAVTVAMADGTPIALETGMLAVRRVDGTDARYDIFLDAQNVNPGAVLKGVIDPQDRLPDMFEVATLDVRATFDRPWDRFAVEDARPQPTKLDMRNMQARWGELDIKLAGVLDVAPGGLATGDIAVKVINWRDVLAIGIENGTIPRNILPLLEGILSAAAKASGPENTLDIPISIQNGQMRLGFIRLGSAPRFEIR